MSAPAGPRGPGSWTRLGLALACFVRVLRGRPLPEALAGWPRPSPLPEPDPQATPPSSSAGDSAAAPAAASSQPARGGAGSAADGAVALLAHFQQSGRLVDFLAEGIDGFSDAQVGAAARAVHRGCAKALRERVRLEPVLASAAADEGAVTVEPGFDPAAVRLSGAVRGDPPFRGRLVHPGWRAAAVDLGAPRAGERVIAPAEVEVGG